MHIRLIHIQPIPLLQIYWMHLLRLSIAAVCALSVLFSSSSLNRQCSTPPARYANLSSVVIICCNHVIRGTWFKLLLALRGTRLKYNRNISPFHLGNCYRWFLYLSFQLLFRQGAAITCSLVNPKAAKKDGNGILSFKISGNRLTVISNDFKQRPPAPSYFSSIHTSTLSWCNVIKVYWAK